MHAHATEAESDVRPAEPAAKFVYAGGSRPLSGYTIKRGVGRGGFGEVYYALSDGGKEVALKLLRRNFDVELRGVAQCLNLKHPHLLGLFDIRADEHDDRWVVMEYVQGPSLEEVIARNPNGLPPAEAVAWLKGIAAGVGYLHECGIVHRDLKPGNIFSDGGLVKIGDYGLSKFISCSRRSGQTESVGTVHYMAPEIANGRYGREIDIYALGIMLHEMLTGRVPFEGESVGEVLMKHLTAQPDVSRLAEPFRSIVARALAKDPQERFASVADLIAALPDVPGSAALVHDLPPVAASVPSRGREPLDRAAAQSPPDPLAATPTAPAAIAAVVAAEEPIRRWILQRLAGFGAAWREQFTTPVKVLIILAGLWGLAVTGGVLVPLAIVLGALYGVYYLGWSVSHRAARAQLGGNGGNDGAYVPPAAAVRTVAQKPAPESRPATPAARGQAFPHVRSRRWHERSVAALIVKTPRERLAELCGSMVLSTLVVLVATLAVLLMWGETTTPEQFAWLALVGIVGAWGVLVPAKLWEGTQGDAALRRFTMLVVGLGVGVVAWGVQQALFVALPNEFSARPVFAGPKGFTSPDEATIFNVTGKVPSRPSAAVKPGTMTPMPYLTYFGFLFLLVRWWRLADPLRGSRLSLWTTAVCVSCAIGLYMFWPFPQRWGSFPQPWGFLVAAVIAVAVQLSSPWAGRQRSIC